jgi:mono/diheme cytochrome c family protein
MKKTYLAGAAGLMLLFCAAALLHGGADNAVAQAVPTAPHEAKGSMPAPSTQSDAIKHGQYLATAGDCIACHTASSGKPFAGGNALATPFGKLLASNITSDRATGIGGWTEQEFVRAVRQGRGKHGQYLYPAMPYNAYVKISDGDMHDLWTYMQTVPPANNKVESNQLPFPFNIRLLMFGWNMLFFDDTPFKSDPLKSVEWNRGAYLVDGLGHCAACHTSKNFLGGDKGGKAMQGGPLAGWYAPEVTGNAYVGVGNWSLDQLAQYLKTGGNDIAMAAGPMAEAVSNSTQHLSDADVRSMAVYLKSLPGSAAVKPTPLAASDPGMVLGKHLYEVNCAACHRSSGTGVGSMVPSLANRPSLQAPDVASLARTVLGGNRGAVTETLPTGAAMPSFDWKLSDAQVAAVLTYSRNSWGNAAARVGAEQVKGARAASKLDGN